MSTRINTNTTAFEAARNLSNNSDKLSKNIQRLSSGLRINSAADDAAGLVISESLQAQSAGLTQATNNTNDAINVVKTAEGALNEVQSLLINIRQTIIEAANVGSSNATALQADKDSVAAAVASIDRIAGTTQFNGKNLLDGSANSAGAVLTAGIAATAPTNAQTATLGLVHEARHYDTVPISNAAVTYTTAKQTVYTVPGDGADAINSTSTFTGSVRINGKTINLGSTPQTLSQLNVSLEAAGSTYRASISASVTGPYYPYNNSGLQFTDSAAAGGPSVGAAGFSAAGLSYRSTDVYNNVATAAAGTGLLTDGNVASVTVTKADGTAYTSDRVTTASDGTSTYGFTSGGLKGLQLSSNASATSLPVVAGTGTATDTVGSGLFLAGDANSYGTTGVASGSADYTAAVVSTATSAGTYTAGDTFSGSLVVKGITIPMGLPPHGETLANLNTHLGIYLPYSHITATVGAGNTLRLTDADGAALSADFTNLHGWTGNTDNGSLGTATVVTGAAGYLTVNGQQSNSTYYLGGYSFFTFNGGQLDGLQLAAIVSAPGSLGTFSATADTPPAAVGTLSATADVAKAGQDLQFQIGANQGQSVNVRVTSQKADAIGSYTNAATRKSYTLSDLLDGGLDITDPTGQAQQDALAVVDQAISDISATREKLGSTQSNALQSNLNTLSVAQENTDASTSTIRDTNLPSEIVSYTKNQILVTAGTSALAYANQAPQAILKLLQ